jgi:N-acetyl-anhydromuramyl-L-alanine amidase AmpD
MPSLIKPNRQEVSRAFPVLGFTVQTPGSRDFEVAVATDPGLFGPEARARRTTSNFYSTRATGTLPADTGHAVYLLPPRVLAGFAGQERIYYRLATFSGPDRRDPEIAALPPDAIPFVYISKSFDGSLRRMSMGPDVQGGRAGEGNGYARESNESLEWAGDAAAPGQIQPAPAASMTPMMAPSAAPAATSSGYQPAAVSYSDGFDDSFWARQQEAGEREVGDAGEVRGIDGPIPDGEADGSYGGNGLAAGNGDGSASYAAAAGRALGAALPEYPQATRFEPAAKGNFYTPKAARKIDMIVIHITDGREKIAGPISWFQNPAAKVSSHYIVGQDGEVVQMVAHADVAYHANSANGHSIGIEHVARTPGELRKDDPGLAPTQAQYAASAALVTWLCAQFGLPVDRDHIKGHAEADLKTTHSGCPDSVWDWTTYMAMVTAAQSLPATAQAADAQSSELGWDVQLIPQPTSDTCWAAAAAMVAGWSGMASFPTSHEPDVEDIPAVARRFGLQMEPAQSYSVQGFRELLETKGPLWVAAETPNFHAVVVTGMRSDGNPDGSGTCLRINDPWDRDPGTDCAPGSYLGSHLAGTRYTQSWQQFVKEYEAVARDLPLVTVQILHAGGTGGRKPAMVGPAGVAQAWAGALGLDPLDLADLNRMKAEFLANKAAGAPKNCITIMNAGLRSLYSARLRNPDGTARALGSTVQSTMAALQGYGLAQAEKVFEFDDAAGRLTKGVHRPDHLHESVEAWLTAQANANAMTASYAFGLSIMDGYHSVILILDFNGPGDPLTRLSWADQIYTGWDDVTGGLDARITDRTQRWWDPLPAARKARTRVTVWPLS